MSRSEWTTWMSCLKIQTTLKQATKSKPCPHEKQSNNKQKKPQELTKFKVLLFCLYTDVMVALKSFFNEINGSIDEKKHLSIQEMP